MHQQGTLEEVDQGCSAQYHCTEQVSMLIINKKTKTKKKPKDLDHFKSIWRFSFKHRLSAFWLNNLKWSQICV